MDYFISHAWKYKFCELVNAITRFELADDNRAGAYYWVDFFAINQHAAEADLVGLEDLVKSSKGVLLVLMPLQRPIPLTRCWCLFEIHSAIQNNVPLLVSVSRVESERFRAGLLTATADESILSLDFDARNAEATVKDDEMRIKDAINKDIGFTELNYKVHIAIVNLFINVALCSVEEAKGSPMYSELCKASFKLCSEIEVIDEQYNIDIQMDQMNKEKRERDKEMQKILLSTD